MALRVYIDGYLQQHSVMRDPGVRVSRELDGYSSRAEFRLRLPVAEVRPQASQHVVVRDDVQLLRNSNRLSETSLTRSNVSAPAPTWGALPMRVGGNGLTWDVAETSSGGYLRNRTYLVEHPLDKFGAESGALEIRYFAHMLFVARSATPATTVIVTARAHNGTSADATEVEFDINDGTWVVNSGTGDVYVDDADAAWWRFVIVSTMTPATATAMPYVEIDFEPNGTATTCCWQISEMASTSIGLTWDDASMVWDDADFTWDDAGPFGPYTNLPPYLDRRNVSANEFLGIVAEVKPSYYSDTHVLVDILAVDYRIKMRRTLVTETYSSQTDQAIITDLLTTYAPYLDPLFTGTAATGLSFVWSGKPLDECLEEVAAQTGKPWRVQTEAQLQYGPSRVDSVNVTFGDTHNLLQWSNDPSTRAVGVTYDSGWNEVGAASDAVLTEVGTATPIAGSRRAWLVEDTSTTFMPIIRGLGPVSGEADTDAFSGQELGVERRFVVGIHVKKGTATNGIVTLIAEALTAFNTSITVATIELNANTGSTYISWPSPISDTLTAITDEDGGEWFRLSVTGVAPVGTKAVGLSFIPARASAFGGSDDGTLTGSVVVSHAYIQLDEEYRYVETKAFTSYVQDNTNWNMASSGEAIADLANVVTVQSDEAGTYDHTATDNDSVDAYGEWETLIIDSSLASDAACQRRAEAELAQKAWPRESVSIECWYKTNLDVGMLAVVAQRHVLQSRAVGQIIQRYTLEYHNAIDQTVTLDLAPFSDDKVIKALRKSLAS